MDLERFLGLLAAMIAFLGSLFLLKGIIALSPGIMARQAQTHMGFSMTLVQERAAQKADAICGVVFVLFAFGIELANRMFVNDRVPCFDSKLIGASVALALSALLGLVLFHINKALCEAHKVAIGKVLMGEMLGHLFQSKKVAVEDAASYRRLAPELLNLEFASPEDGEAVIRQVAEVVGKPIPSDVTFYKAHP